MSKTKRDRLEQLAPDAKAAILVPLVFRGERLGVLAAINGPGDRRFEDEDEQLLMSIAASAATAVATARSVAAARLRLSLEAADQARARWARELHDETLQGLTGVRMVLSAGLARDDFDNLQRSAETADAHLGDEMRKLRDLIAELRPAALDDLGLGPAIDSLAKRQAAIGGFAAERSKWRSAANSGCTPTPRPRSIGSSRRRSATSSSTPTPTRCDSA